MFYAQLLQKSVFVLPNVEPVEVIRNRPAVGYVILKVVELGAELRIRQRACLILEQVVKNNALWLRLYSLSAKRAQGLNPKSLCKHLVALGAAQRAVINAIVRIAQGKLSACTQLGHCGAAL